MACQGGGARRVLWAKQSFPPSHPVMRSSPDVKVRIPAAAGRSCTGAPHDPCSLQSGAATLGLVGSKVSAGFEVLIYRKEGQVSVSEGLWWPLKNGKRVQLTPLKFQEPNAPASPGALNIVHVNLRQTRNHRIPQTTPCDRATWVESTTRPSTFSVHKVRPSQSPHSPASRDCTTRWCAFRARLEDTYLERQRRLFFHATFKKHVTFAKWQEFLPLAKKCATFTKNCHFQGKLQFFTKNCSTSAMRIVPRLCDKNIRVECLACWSCLEENGSAQFSQALWDDSNYRSRNS